MSVILKKISPLKATDNKNITECSVNLSEIFKIRLINLGATLTSLILTSPKTGKKIDVLLGYENYQDYNNNEHYMGCIIGRVANRIKNGEIMVGNKKISLDKNAGKHHIHGGKHSLTKALWDIEILKYTPKKCKIRLSYKDKQKKYSYPGSVNFNIVLEFKLLQTNTMLFTINLNAQPDQITPLNLTYHPYFNLAGHTAGNIDGHSFKILSTKIAENDLEQIPTGKIINIKNTALDLTNSNQFSNINTKQDIFGKLGGFDHHYFFGKNFKNKKMAIVTENANQLSMEVFSTLPGLQFYTAGNLNISHIGKENKTYLPYSAFCMEPQYAPASIFKQGRDYPSIMFSPADVFKHQITYKFTFF